ncbi:MAG TPA: class IV adenylate cyclase [Steroidobacteraceae bacterium]|jgi:predicted adenylyl cyclase CyaB|nr:class IV adenylate cyclase [Steroidobacteraceae bacterium]
MLRNIEIKARLGSVEELLPTVGRIAQQGPWEITQDDTYFACATGRLKLRALSAHEGELIYYQRADQLPPKESRYLRSGTSAPETLRETLRLAYGEVGRVRKRRTLFLCGRTRIHLDRVEGLGHFLELEVVLADGEPAAEGVRVAHELMRQLGVSSAQLIAGGYLELLAGTPAR